MTRVSPSSAGVWRVQIQHGQTWRTVSEVRGFKSDALREALKHAEARHDWPGLLDTLTTNDDRHPILQRLAYLNLLIDWERDVAAEAEATEARS